MNSGFQAVTNLISVAVPLIFGLVIDQFGDRAVLLCAAVPSCHWPVCCGCFAMPVDSCRQRRFFFAHAGQGSTGRAAAQ